MDVAAPPAKDWSLLPIDVLSSIFVRVGAVDVLMGAGLVCRSWLVAAKLPDVWRAVDMESHEFVLLENIPALCEMAKAAVDRSDEQLRTFVGKYFVTDELMKYIVESSPSLTTLRLISCYYAFSKRVASVIKQSPLLELRSLRLHNTYVTVQELTAVLDNCPVLELLRVHNCFEIDVNEEEHALRSKLARIRTMTIWCDDEYRLYFD